MTPEVYLNQGAQILGRKLYPLGFAFEMVANGDSSGGPFAVGHFTKGDRILALSFRHALGLVSYRKGEIEKSHAEYMQALGREGKSAYPGFNADKMGAFHDLLSDLDYCESFLGGDGDAFAALMQHYEYRPRPKGLA